MYRERVGEPPLPFVYRHRWNHTPNTTDRVCDFVRRNRQPSDSCPSCGSQQSITCLFSVPPGLPNPALSATIKERGRMADFELLSVVALMRETPEAGLVRAGGRLNVRQGTRSQFRVLEWHTYAHGQACFRYLTGP